MKKKLLQFFVIVSIIGCCLSCTADSPQPPDEYVNPLKNVYVQEDTFDVDEIVGSYFVYNSSTTKYYYASLCDDGTFMYIPFAPSIYAATDGTLTKTTWSYSGNTDIRLEAFGNTYNRTIKDHTNSSTGQKDGFYISTGTYYINFIKISDNYINEDVYTDHSLLYNCIWAHTDDYGKTTGYKFNSDLSLEFHNSTRDHVSTSQYLLGNTYNRIKLDSNQILPEEYNYAVIGNYLYLATLAYKCIGKDLPVKGPNKTELEFCRKVEGIWAFYDTDKNKMAYYDFNKSGEVYRIGRYKSGYTFREKGTWSVSNGLLSMIFPSETTQYPAQMIWNEKNKCHLLCKNGIDISEEFLAREYDSSYQLLEKNAYSGSIGDKNPRYLVGTWDFQNDKQDFLQLKDNGTGYLKLSEIGIVPITWSCSEDQLWALTVMYQSTAIYENQSWTRLDCGNNQELILDIWQHLTLHRTNPQISYDPFTDTWTISNY